MRNICPHPEKCKEEASWIHNPLRGWSYIQANWVNGSQGVCYASPESFCIRSQGKTIKDPIIIIINGDMV